MLGTLHLYLYDRGVEALDTEALEQVRALAERALAGPTDPWVLEWGAMGLALLVGGPELREAVEEMAASDEAVRMRLAVPADASDWKTDYEPRWVETVRSEAAHLLADPNRTPYYRRAGCEPGFDFPKPPFCQ